MTALNFMRSTNEPTMSAGVMTANVIWNRTHSASGMVPLRVDMVTPCRNDLSSPPTMDASPLEPSTIPTVEKLPPPTRRPPASAPVALLPPASARGRRPAPRLSCCRAVVRCWRANLPRVRCYGARDWSRVRGGVLATPLGLESCDWKYGEKVGVGGGRTVHPLGGVKAWHVRVVCVTERPVFGPIQAALGGFTTRGDQGMGFT